MKTLRQQFLEHVAQTSPSPLAIEVERAEGVFFYSPPSAQHPEGKRYFDLISGVSVSNVGHANPAVVRAVQEQAATYMHTMVYGETIQAPQVRYAARLAELLPPRLQSVYFVSSGAEAVEGALKLAKRATGRRRMLSFRGAYHGSTHGSLSMMSSPDGDEWREPFLPLLPDVDYLTYNDFRELDRITRHTACVLVEPVRGEAGVRLPEEGYLAALRERCDETGTLLIFDEVQTGMGRTGTMFAFERETVVPDILCLAKAFGGGMPLGAFIASGKLMSVLSHDPALGHITTFGGHPVCCAAGLAALEYILESDLLASVEAKGALFERLLGRHPAVGEIRRAGLLMAVELKEHICRPAAKAAPILSEEGREERISRLMKLFIERGILSDWFLFCDTAFRISPPLTITEEQIRESCKIILSCLDEL